MSGNFFSPVRKKKPMAFAIGFIKGANYFLLPAASTTVPSSAINISC